MIEFSSIRNLVTPHFFKQKNKFVPRETNL
ncbi:hypothetical protein DFR57_11344 [Saliterribacillus persicus]|uniref:Uncharacterized protein n=1 Tax=Saliterribacillus persicus TaxID=930114 RepID=A0A368X9E3_9BACI|nr:hypothetical protein DFR57_11344 [Saliterribacillus persicus]